jgi:hypothetical protein
MAPGRYRIKSRKDSSGGFKVWLLLFLTIFTENICVEFYWKWTALNLNAILQNLFLPLCSKQTAYVLVLKKTPWSGSANELYRPNDCHLSGKLVPTFADRGCHVVSVTNPYGSNLDFLDRSRYFFFQVATQLYSRGWLDPVPDPLLLRKSGSVGNRTRTSRSVARNSDH